MKFTYDPRYNIAYIRFREKHGDIDSVRISDELVIDMAPDGTLYPTFRTTPQIFES